MRKPIHSPSLVTVKGGDGDDSENEINYGEEERHYDCN